MTNSNIHTILFQPDGIRVRVPVGTILTEAMEKAGIKIQLPCGGVGRCGKCIVEIQPDPPEPNQYDRLHLNVLELEHGSRLACQVKADRDMSVLFKPGVRVVDGQILVTGLEQAYELNPCIEKKYVELPEPSLDDQAADLFRIGRELGLDSDSCPPFDIETMRNLHEVLRESDMKVTVVTTDDGRVIGIESGDTTGELYGMAFDVGTTTVVGTIIDLTDGRDLGHASRLNAQVVYGEDTISRIKHAVENENGRDDMREKILEVLNEIVEEASKNAGIDPQAIYEMVLVGNTTMSHLLLGLDPAGLSQIPFVPVTNAAVTLRARDTGIDINPGGRIYTLPNIAGFVGSDTVAVMLSCNYLDEGPVQLAVDVGTNGELALRTKDRLIVCSTAAGPALEGAQMLSGMRAAAGAAEHVRITDTKIELDIIGDAEPVGICGSGIIDCLAELLDNGVVDAMGRLLAPDELPEHTPAYLKGHIIDHEGEPAFNLLSADAAKKILMTQKDIRQLQLAKGAISAGITLLLKEGGIELDNLEEILLAGAFGNYIKKASAQRIGLLPNIDAEKIKFVGNAASTGARMALLSRKVREDADRIRNVSSHIELAALPEFMTAYSDSMLFP